MSTASRIRSLTPQADTGSILTLEQAYGQYKRIKPIYDEVARAAKRVKQTRDLLDSKTRAKTLVDLAVEATYRVAQALTDVGGALPVVQVFKAYHQTHFKVLAAAVQAMSDHERAREDLRRLSEISNRITADSPPQLKNYGTALADQKLAARNEAAVVRMFRPAGYHATGIADRIVAGLVKQASPKTIAAAFPGRSPDATKTIADKVFRDSRYQKEATDSMRDNIDLAYQQLVEVTAAATTYRHLIATAVSINAAIAHTFEQASSKKLGSLATASRIESERLIAQEIDHSMPRVLDLERIDDQWDGLVSNWEGFCERLRRFSG